MTTLVDNLSDVKPSRKNRNGRKPPIAPKSNRTGRALTVWIDEAVGSVLDKYLEETEPRPTITAVIELALRRYFESIGRWPPPRE